MRAPGAAADRQHRHRPARRPQPARRRGARACARRSSTWSSATAAGASPSSAGRRVNAEAEHRYAIYRAVLEERGLEFDPNLVCEGTFEKAAGEAAVELLVDERKVQFDGAGRGERLHGAGRDPGAAGARPAGAVGRRGRRLRRHRGRPVLDAAADHRAPAAVPAGRGGARSRARADRGRGGRAPDHRRDRAGRPPVVRLPVRPDPPRPRRHGHADVRPRWRACSSNTATMSRARSRARSTAPTRRCRRAGIASSLDAFEAELRGAGAGLFASTLDRLLGSVGAAGDDVGAWQADGVRAAPAAAAGAAQRAPALGAGGGPVARGAHPDRRAGRARPGAAPPAQRAARERAHRERRHAAGDPAGRRADGRRRAPAAAAGDPQRVDGAVRNQPTGARSPTRPDASPAWCCATTPSRCWPAAAAIADAAPADGTRSPAAALLPTMFAQLGRRASIVVEPLFFHDRPLGCLLLEMGPREGMVYESLAEQVSSALEGARLVDRLVDEATRRQVAERERLEKEMEIAARIQTSILPRDVSVAGLEIAAAMQPATEVGGDYYDVVPVDDGCWLGIGDVAGHGLGTGLVMLMMQSGIGALARKLPDALAARPAAGAEHDAGRERPRAPRAARTRDADAAPLSPRRQPRRSRARTRRSWSAAPPPAAASDRDAGPVGGREARHRRRDRRQQRPPAAGRSAGALHRRPDRSGRRRRQRRALRHRSADRAHRGARRLPARPPCATRSWRPSPRSSARREDDVTLLVARYAGA